MKLEDINSEKFSMFESEALSNLKLVVGGDWTNTEGLTTGEIDRFNTGRPGQEDGWEQSTYAADHIPWGIG